MDINKEFINFMKAYDNYDLYDHTELLKSATKTFINTANYNYEEAKNEYDKFMDIILDDELEGTSDLINPIENIYHDHVKSKINKRRVCSKSNEVTQ